MNNGIDPAIAAAQPADAPRPAETAAIDPLRKEADALLASDPASPHHALYQQALKGLDQVDARRFKDRKERERVALAIAMQATALGVTRIDRVAASESPSGYFYVNEHAVDPAMRGFVGHAEAAQPLTRERVAELQRAVREQESQQQQVQQTQQQVREQRQGQETQSARAQEQARTEGQRDRDDARRDSQRDADARRDRQAGEDAARRSERPPQRTL